MMTRKPWHLWALGLLGGLALASAIWARQDQAPPSKKDQVPAPGNRLTVEVTGGDANKPVENASVYVKTVEEHLIKDKKSEVSVKTNQQGVAHVPDSPMGRVLVQVVA